MPGCAAIGCNNRSEKGYTMKCFPRNPKLRKIWTEKVSRADWEPSNNSFLCHVHFEADQWTITQSGRLKLKKSAVPSIFTITSTRKSPRKRRKLVNGEEEDLYIIEYLDDPTNPKFSTVAQNTAYNRYTTSNITTVIGRPVYTRSSCRTATKIVMRDRQRNETIVISDDNNETSTKPKRANGIVRDSKDREEKNSSEIGVKTEMKSRNDSNCEIDDIEEKLRSICDGESQSNEKTNTMERQINNENNKNESSKGASRKFSGEEKCSSKYSSLRKNGNSIKDQEISLVEDATNRKRRSRLEITKNVERTVGVANKSTNGVIGPREIVKKSYPEASSTARRSTFTIKLTGNEADVTEIVEDLGTEPILKYKSSNESSNNNRGFITSVISVTDTFPTTFENCETVIEPKVEICDSSSNDNKNESSVTMNDDKRENRDSVKLAVESPADDDDDVSTMDLERLRKKVKFQTQVIKKLTNQLGVGRELESTTNHINTRSQSRKRKVTDIPCNGDCQNKETLMNEISSKLFHTNKLLNEHKQNSKKLQCQIRNRDNRVKELIWKLNKASKFIERAERNANMYRKKMISLQNLLTRKTLEARIGESAPISRNEEKSTVPAAKESIKPIVISRVKNLKNSEPNTSNERIVCKTVQDIFEESNHCDDDDPIIIDNAEDFMRQFAGSL